MRNSALPGAQTTGAQARRHKPESNTHQESVPRTETAFLLLPYHSFILKQFIIVFHQVFALVGTCCFPQLYFFQLILQKSVLRTE